MFNGRILIEGNIVLNFLVEEGIYTEDAECNLRGDIEILTLFEKFIECWLKDNTVKRRAISIFISVLDVCKCLLISRLSGSTRNTSDWLGKPRMSTLILVSSDKLDIERHLHAILYLYFYGALSIK